jgi:excisionase family DNA binding protein
MTKPNDRPLDEPFMTAAEVAALLRVSLATVYRLRWRGGFPCYRVGGRMGFKRADIERWREGRRGDRDLLTVAAAAEMLGVSRATVYDRLRWRIPCRKVDGRVRFRREDVMRYLEDSKA